MRGVSGKEWVLLSERLRPPRELVELYGPVLAQLLVNRGLEKDHESFFDLKLKNLLHYSLIPNVEEGIERIVRAVRRGERIVIFGDYDVDGITGTAILYEILREAGAKVVPVLPNRGNGYGLNQHFVSVFSRYGDLLVTVDNGTSAVREIDGGDIDVIVIDHHNVPEETPERAILINTKLIEDDSDMRELSSSAICFYIGAVLVRELGIDVDPRIFLDLVALGTVGDVMPMNVTNRILVSKGLSVLEGVLNGSVKKAGMRALLRYAGVRERVTSRDVAYSIAPRINAPGRVSDPKLSLNLLIEKDDRRAEELARKVEAINSRRRAITDRVYREAYRKATQFGKGSFLTLWGRDWHVGVLGIVAGRLSSLLGKPVAVFSKGSSHSVGSVRSVEGVDVYSGLKKLSHMFLKWGGHPQAAGLTLETSLLERFSRSMEEIFSHLPPKPPPLYVDMELSPRNVGREHLEALRRLEPLGEGNPEPTFLSEELPVEEVSVRFGRAKVRVGGVSMVCWNKNVFTHLRVGQRMRVVYSLNSSGMHLLDVEDRDGSR